MRVKKEAVKLLSIVRVLILRPGDVDYNIRDSPPHIYIGILIYWYIGVLIYRYIGIYILGTKAPLLAGALI